MHPNDSTTIAGVDLYGQEPEARLLGAFPWNASNSRLVDRRGGGAWRLRGGDAARRTPRRVHAIEPEPENAAFTRASAFASIDRVDGAQQYAISDSGRACFEFHTSVDVGGRSRCRFGHTPPPARPGTERSLARVVTVEGGRSRRSIEARRASGARGDREVDTEGRRSSRWSRDGRDEERRGHGRAVARLPHSLGACPGRRRRWFGSAGRGSSHLLSSLTAPSW